MVEISVVIPSLKPRAEIECLDRLDRGDFADYEVIVRRDVGASTARNEGIRRAEADKLVFLDDDSRPREGYLARVADRLDDVSVLTGRTVHPGDDVIGRHFTDHYAHGSIPAVVDRFISCNVALRREVFETVGLFDENFTWGYEETELAGRIRSAYEIHYDPELVVDHAYATSYRDFWVKRYRQETQRAYYWQTQGRSLAYQLGWTALAAVRPSRYVGASVPLTVAKSGRTVAATIGRFEGIARRLAGSTPAEPKPLDPKPCRKP